MFALRCPIVVKDTTPIHLLGIDNECSQSTYIVIWNKHCPHKPHVQTCLEHKNDVHMNIPIVKTTFDLLGIHIEIRICQRTTDALLRRFILWTNETGCTYIACPDDTHKNIDNFVWI